MNNLQVFWAEDEIEERNLIRRVFEAHFNRVDLVFFSNGANLINALEDAAFLDQLPDLVVIDLNMPYSDGRDVLQQASKHEELRKVPMVLFSGTSNRLDGFYLSFFKAKRYTKPADIIAYRKVIQEMINAELCIEAKNE